MARLKIVGGKKLQGEMIVSGSKNAVLPILAATVLTDEECIIWNVPKITDVAITVALLEELGKTVTLFNGGKISIKGSVKKSLLNNEIGQKIRGSILFLGPLLAKTGKVLLGPLGGCRIGYRRIGTHFNALKILGVNIVGNEVHCEATLSKPQAGRILLDEISVTATENAMMCAAMIPDETVIENAACEPYIIDLGIVLRKMGAKIIGEGTNRLSIHGNRKLGGFEHRVVPDHIEAGTMIIASVCTRGNVIIHDIRREHMRPILVPMERMGLLHKFHDDVTLEILPSDLKALETKIQTCPWPGFPTDLMSPFVVLATQANGIMLCHDWMYESRMFFVSELVRMGANITLCDPHRILVSGPTRLRAQTLSSPDIRAGVALVIAALVASGTSTIEHAELIDRGYENFAERLVRLGAEIERKE